MSSIRIPARPVTAFSVANALGSTTEEVFSGVFAGRSGLAENVVLQPFGAILGAVPTLAALPPELASWDTRQARVAHTALVEIADEIRRATRRWGAGRVAIIVGSSTGGMATTEAAHRIQRREGRLPPEFSLFRHHAFDAVPAALSTLLGIEGPSVVVSTACSSSGKAFASALRWIDAGLADAVLVGGVDSLCQLTVRGFSSLNILSRERCQPFGAERKGINIGEGAAFALIERATGTEVLPRGWLLGVGESCDGHHMTAPRADGLGAALAMRAALAHAGVPASAVDYVNAHGTGTVLNDSAESLAVRDVFGDAVWVSSTKGAVGHLLGAAGATEAVVCLAALERQELPPNIGGDHVDAALPVRLVPTPASESSPAVPARPLRFAISNSFAFGGNNVSVLVGTEPPPESPAEERYEVDVVDVSLWAPGFANLEAWLAGVSDAAVTLPECRLLPARSRGRASLCSRILIDVLSPLAAAAENAVNLATVPSLFASALGEMETTVDLLDMLNGESGELSPARFQASVHNTASGIFSIAMQNLAFSSSIAAGVDTPALALAEAYAWIRLHGGQLLVAIGDEPNPERLAPDDTYSALGVGVLLEGRRPGEPRPLRRLGTIESFIAAPDGSFGRAVTGDETWCGNPCAAGVHFVERLAARTRGIVSLVHPSRRTGWALRVG